MKSDTIAAIATALSDAGIGIIRISGPEAIAVANRVVVNKKERTHAEKLADAYDSLWFRRGERNDSG